MTSSERALSSSCSRRLARAAILSIGVLIPQHLPAAGGELLPTPDLDRGLRLLTDDAFLRHALESELGEANKVPLRWLTAPRIDFAEMPPETQTLIQELVGKLEPATTGFVTPRCAAIPPDPACAAPGIVFRTGKLADRDAILEHIGLEYPDYRPTMAQLFTLWSEANDDRFCVVVKETKGREIVGALIFASAASLNANMSTCIVEEFLHALGVAGDDPANPHTIFDDDVNISTLTDHDYALISVLYHPLMMLATEKAGIRNMLPIIRRGLPYPPFTPENLREK